MRAWPGYSEDKGTSHARISTIVRQNLSAEIDNTIEAEVVDIKSAELVVVALPRNIRFKNDFDETIKNHLSGQAVVGDTTINIQLASTKRGEINTQVYIVEMVPKEGAIITANTEIQLSERPKDYWIELREYSILYEPVKRSTVHIRTILHRIPRILFILVLLVFFATTMFVVSYILSIVTDPAFLSWLTGLSSLSLVLAYLLNAMYSNKDDF